MQNVKKFNENNNNLEIINENNENYTMKKKIKRLDAKYIDPQNKNASQSPNLNIEKAEKLNLNGKLFQVKKSVLKNRPRPIKNAVHKSKIVQKFILETEISKATNKKFIFMGGNETNLDRYTEMVKQ